MRFSVDKRVLSIEKKKLNGYIGGIIGFAICTVIMSFVFFSDDVQSMKDKANTYIHYDQECGYAFRFELAYLCYIIMILILAVSLIVSIRKYLEKKQIARNYEKSYIEINGDTITGVAFHMVNAVGYSFTVNVSELIKVFYYEKSPLNLKLTTCSQSYSCLAIERASELAMQLKQRIAELKEADAEGGKSE